MNRLHPASAVVYALRYGFLWVSIPAFLLVPLAGVVDTVSAAWAPVVAVLALVAGLAYGVAYYYRFGYRITDDTFDVASGVFARRSREIPYGRIQNVDIRQGVAQRLLGLATVSIETAGGGDTEASLTFVGETEATRLQGEIRRRTATARDRQRRRRSSADSTSESVAESPERTGTPDRAGTPDRTDGSIGPGPGAGEPITDRTGGSDVAPVDEGSESAGGREEPDDRSGAGDATPTREPRRQRLFDLQSRELLLYAFTSFRPAAVAAVTFVFFLATDPIIEYLLAVSQPVGGPPDLGSGSAGNYGVLTVVTFVNGVLVTYLLSVAYTFATYYGFRLGRIGDDFVYERGLLQRYSGSIPADKVQSVTITDNPAQRLIGYAGLWVETAGYGPDSGEGSQSAVPMARRERIHAFTENLTGLETPRFTRPPPLARRRYLVRYGLVALAVVAVASGLAAVVGFDRWYLAAALFAVVPAAAHLKYVHLGYFVGEDHLVIRRGFWRRRTTVVPYYRLQTVSTRRSIFQRRLGLASLVVDTASSRSFVWAAPTVYDVSLEDARDVHEETRDRLQSALRDRSGDDLGLSVDFT